MVRLWLGVPRLFERIRAEVERGLYGQILIVPHHYTHEAERLLSKFCGDSVSLNCEVLSMNRLADRVFGACGGLSDRVLEEGGRLLLLNLAGRAVSSQLRSFGAYREKPEFLMELLHIIDELKTHGVSARALEEAAAVSEGITSEKLSDLALLYSAYESLLTAQISDPAGRLAKLAEQLENCDYAVGKTVYVHNFTTFTPLESRVLESLMRKTDQIIFTFEPEQLDHVPGGAEDLFLDSRTAAGRIRRIAEKHGIALEIEVFKNRKSASDEVEHLRHALFRAPLQPYPEACKRIKLYRAETRWTEVEQAAAEIRRLCADEGFRFRDILVAVTDSSAYAEILEAVFESYEIPFYSDQPSPILEKPVMAAALAAIDCVCSDFRPEDVLRYLKTGLSGVSYEDGCKLENYITAWNLRTKAWTSERDWTHNPFGLSKEFDERATQTLDAINAARRRCSAPLRRLWKNVHQEKTAPASKYAEQLYAFFLELELDRFIQEKRTELAESGHLQTADEYAQLWGYLCSALDEMHTVLHDTQMEFEEFVGLFRLLLSSMRIGTIPVAVDRVVAGDAGRMRHRAAKVVMLLGAAAGAFPQPAKNSGILTEEDRSALLDCGIEVEKPASRLLERELEGAHAILTAPQEKLYLSYPLRTQEAEQTPSYLMVRIADLFSVQILPPKGEERLIYARQPCKGLVLGHSASAVSQAAYTYFMSKAETAGELRRVTDKASAGRGSLSPEAVRSLSGEKIRMTASRADLLQSCRYAYFLQYGLRAQPRFTAEMDSLESGTFLHYVLQKTLSGHGDATSEEISRQAAFYSEEYAKKVLGGLTGKSARIRYLFGRLKQTAAIVCINAAEELRVSKFAPLRFEMKFGDGGVAPAAPDGGLELAGTVDRVDGWIYDKKLYIRVIDYKSGVKKFDLNDIWHGLGMQMLLYLFALQAQGEQIFGEETVGAGVHYFPVREPFVAATRGEDPEEIRKKADKLLLRSGLALDMEEVLEAMEAGPKKRFLSVTKSSLCTLEQMGKLKRHLDKTLERIKQTLSGGEIAANPYYRDLKTNACMYCPFGVACRYDESTGEDRMRYLYKLKADEFWERMEG